MKKIILLVLSLSILFGCATLPEIPKFEDSNAYLIKQSIEQINIVDTLSDYIDKEDKIALVSLENPKTFDNSITSVIEDVFLKQFVDKGYFVVERDDDLLYRLMSESDTTFSYLFHNKKRSSYRSFDAGFQSGFARVGNILNPYATAHSEAAVAAASRFNEIENFDNYKIPTNLLPADKIIAYRVLEAGIVYEYEGDVSFADSLNRIANTILLLRTEDAQTGKIINITSVKGNITDKISKEEKKMLEKFHYRHYRFGYPNIYGNPTQLEYDNSKNKTPSKKGLYILGTIGGILILVLVIGS